MTKTHCIYSAILFDLDGTLIDTTQTILDSLKHTINFFTGKTPTEAELRPYMGQPLIDQLSYFIPGSAEAALSEYVKHNLSNHHKVKPYPCVITTLNVLKDKGVKLAIVTSKRRRTALVGLEMTGIGGAFQTNVFYETTQKHKPEPEPVLAAIEMLDLKCRPAKLPHKILMIGDSPSDILSAKKAAKHCSPESIIIESAGVTYGAYEKEDIKKAEPDHIFDDISQLLTLCRL